METKLQTVSDALWFFFSQQGEMLYSSISIIIMTIFSSPPL